MWPLFGATNQMLAAIALILCTVILFKMKRERFAWVTIVPDACGCWSARSPRDWRRSSRPIRRSASSATRSKFGAAAAAGTVLAPAKTLDEMSRIVFNDYLDAGARRALGGDRAGGGGLRDRRHRQGAGLAQEHGGRGRQPRSRRREAPDARTADSQVCACFAQTARLMVGIPDYENYVAHRRKTHPDLPIMTYEQFFRERQQARYAVGKGRFRCCC